MCATPDEFNDITSHMASSDRVRLRSQIQQEQQADAESKAPLTAEPQPTGDSKTSSPMVQALTSELDSLDGVASVVVQVGAVVEHYHYHKSNKIT